VGALLLGCSSERAERPPSYRASADASLNANSCGDIQTGRAVGNAVWLEDEPAACAATGLVCPLGGRFQRDGTCSESAVPTAYCEAQRWIVRCADAGTP